MIITVHELSSFAENTDFRQDIYYSWKTQDKTQDQGAILPRVEVTKTLYGVGVDGEFIVYERVSTVTLDDAGDSPNYLQGINEAVRARILSFEEEVKRLAKSRGCRAIAGTLEPSPVSAALSSMLVKGLESLEARVSRLESDAGEGGS